MKFYSSLVSHLIGAGIIISVFIGCQKKEVSEKQEKSIKAPETVSIVGGSPITISNRSFQAGVTLDGNADGGAIILSQDWILTAAHVVSDQTTSQAYATNRIKVFVGSNSYYLNIVERNVDNIILYPGYNFSGLTHDIALLHLSSPLTFSSSVAPINYAANSNSPLLTLGQIGVVSGWGSTSIYGFGASDELLTTNVKISNIQQQYFESTRPDPNGQQQGVCSGDSGGPITVTNLMTGNPILVGVIKSVVGDCITGSSQYTKLSYYAGWIFEKTGIHNMAISGPSILCNSGTYEIENLPTNATIKWLNVPASIQNDPSISYDATYGNIVKAEISIGNRTINLQKQISITPEVFTGLGLHEISSNALGGGSTLINHDHDFDDYRNTISFSFNYYPNLTLKYLIIGPGGFDEAISGEIRNVTPNTPYALPASLPPGFYNFGAELVDDCGRSCSDPFEAGMTYSN